MSIKQWWDKTKKKLSSINETEFLPAILEVTETPPSPIGRIVLWTIVVLMAVGISWAILGHVDEVAIAGGKIVPVGQVKVIQADDKGIVKGIYVQNGQDVKKGQVLIELDQTVSAADLARIKKQIAYYNLELERLTAEIGGTTFVPTANVDLDAKELPIQLQLYQSRMTEFQVKSAAVQMEVQQNLANINSAQANLQKFAEQLAIAADKEERLERLVSENAVALFQLLDQRARRMELTQNLKAQESELARAQSAMSQSEQKLANILAERNREIMTSFVEDRKQLMAYTEELKKADEKNRLAKIISPVDGRVHQLALNTLGGIATAAQPLMIIVPDDTRLEVEAWADNKDIGFLQEGQKAEVKVATFNFQKFGMVDATVVKISPDAQEAGTDKTKDKKYRLILELDKQDIAVGNRLAALSPGMEVVAEVKIREKRIIEFFLDTFRQYSSEALRER